MPPKKRGGLRIAQLVPALERWGGLDPVYSWALLHAFPMLRGTLAEDALLRRVLGKREEPLSALTSEVRPLHRAALQRAALRLGVVVPPFVPSPSLCSMPAFLDLAERRAAVGHTLEQNAAAYAKLVGGPMMMRGPFMYQIAQRRRAPPTYTGKLPVVDGEFVPRRFVTFRDAEGALRFLVQWYATQLLAPPAQRVSVFECGSMDATLRKWVIDIDAKHDDLRARGLPTDPDLLLPLVLGLAHAAARCPFAVTSRHSERRCSWHITLCALAPLSTWRAHMADFGRSAEAPWRLMLPFVDAAVLNNSHSQYMQIWGSTKVAPGLTNTPLFRWEGVWASPTKPLLTPSGPYGVPLFMAATSVMLHDPWCVLLLSTTGVAYDPLTRSIRAKVVPPPAPKTKRKPSEEAAPRKAKKQAKEEEEEARFPWASWDGLPMPQCRWMREFVEEGRTCHRLERLPSMNDSKNWPNDIHKALAHRDTQVWLYAHIRSVAVCPRFLLCEGRLHSHERNTALVFCFRDGTQRGRYRMLMRCFSEACGRVAAPHARCARNGWVEVIEDDLRVARLKRSGAPAPTVGEEEELPWEKAVPTSAHARTWMRRLVTTTLTALSGPPTLPPVVVALLQRQGRASVTAHASATLVGCPRLLPQAVVEGHGPSELLFVAHSDPHCPGVSHRLFALCPSADCAHVRAEGGGPWVELTPASLPKKK